jgi:signal transduction histidine kinase
VHGFAQAIVEGEVAGDGVKWAAGLIQRETRRLVRMVEGLLQVARLEAGAQGMAREAVDLEPIVEGAIAALAVQAKEAQVGVQRDLRALPAVAGDPDKLSQLFLNLLDNALKHTPAGMSVQVRGAQADGAVVVRVTDEGSGLPEGAGARLFQRFWRGDSARGGTGLGLAIAQAIAQAHGGRIEARNVEGGGAEFAVHLPRA